MAVAGGPNIVEDGLVLCLDAGNGKSYPGSGTAWNDLSNSPKNGTLQNGPTYSSANGGAIVFDGTDDQVILPQSTIWNFGLGDFAVEIWAYPTSFADNPTLVILGPYYGTAPKGMLFYLNTNTGHPSVYTNLGYIGTSTAATLNAWNHIVFTRISGTIYTYVQTVPGSTFNLSTWSITTGSNVAIGRDTQYSNGAWSGRISAVRIYNKRLTAAEVAQNFNATRSRYGI